MQAFISAKKPLSKITLALALVLVVAFTFTQSVFSKRPLDINFGTTQTLNLFPANVSTNDWAGTENVLIQDLTDTTLYQEFSARSSAYVPQPELLIPTPTPSTAPVSTPSEIEAGVTEPGTADQPQEPTSEVPAAGTDEPTEVPPPVSEPEPVVEEVPAPEPEAPAPEPAPTEPVSFLPPSPTSAVFATSWQLFPLAQLSIVSPAEPVAAEEPATPEPTVEAEPQVDPVLEPQPQSDPAAAPEPETQPEPTAVEPAPTPTDEPTVLPDETLASEPVAPTPETQPEAVEAPVATFPTHDIVLSDFDTPPLEPGQFVTGMQLRLSFAARLDDPTIEPTPYVEVLFSTPEEQRTVGIIPLDDEVSNALNGGYFLFALPDIVSLEALADVSVTVRYHGEADALDGMFLDAAWLELETRTVTKEDLKKRGVAGQITGLELPTVSTLISDQVNFRRDESPLFNLRYNSQRNFIIRGLRNLMGRDLVSVESVAVTHRSFGLLGIEPELTITKNGLLTIEIPSEDLANMRPGEYEVTLTLNEGGVEFTDTFNFTWGILSTNPNKSEYQVGETAHISIGALTPSGHTICEADLDLYVTDPLGYVSRVAVTPSGQCNGNNVVDVPDFSALVPVTVPGAYELYLERLDDTGAVLGFTTDTFNAVLEQDISIERSGPTRIYPPAMYPMTLTVSTTRSFTGTLTEVVPASFLIYDTEASITSDGITQTLEWELDLLAGNSETVSYRFDAPDISPYLFNLGPARLDAESGTVLPAEPNASTSARSSPAVEPMSGNVFIEHRRWQIASDAVGKMLLFWPDGATLPTDWVCVSCTSGDPFFQRFAMGSSTYNNTGGATTHTHTASGSILATTDITTEPTGANAIAIGTHTHTYNPAIGTASNLPEYRQLRVIRYDAAAGEPATIPAGAIGIFDVASSSLPSGWNRYAAQDGKYIYGEDTPGTTGGSNTHTHSISGTTGAAAGGSYQSRGPDAANGSTPDHTHTISGSTGSVSNEPPYIEVLLGQLTTDAAPPNGLIAMWDEEVDSGWVDVSSAPTDAFSNRFLKASTTYGATSGAITHSHADVTGLTSSVPSAIVTTARAGSGGASDVHTHSTDVTNFSTDAHLPPYVTVVFGKRQGTDPVYAQNSSRWYVNTNAQTPTDPWPSGGTDLTERVAITATSTPVKNGAVVRLRMNVGVTNATSTAGATFKLQYAAADTCSAASGWLDVGDTSSSTLWRGYNNTSVNDHSTISSLLLASSTVAATYEENGYATSTPNDIPLDGYGEWDFVLQQNGALAGTNYCFRLVESDGTALLTYSHYPQLFTNEAPNNLTLEKLFDNEKTASTTPWFYFYATDAEGEKVHYEIEVADNYTFTSPVIDRNTISHSAQFENQVLISDKAPFNHGQLIRFTPSTSLTNGTTYYWRVRAQDPEGSGAWGDWSTIYSFTTDNTLDASAWFQTENEQFDTNTLSGVETTGDSVSLISGSTTGSMTSTPIDFTDGERGTAWDNLSFSETDTNSVLEFQIEYLDGLDTWTLIPDGDLPGNAAGFGTSPVSLLGLDVDTYQVIRVVANFTANTGSPSLQDWTINWGYLVETPTITKLFPSEQVGTTTPTFEFTTTDPQSDSLTYEVQWSLTPDFAASTTRISDTDAGFANIDLGADTDPFISGDTIQFTIQPADALTGTTTYWWRVRAKDTTGDNAWSFWTTPRSFTVIPGTEVSTWFQTTEEQFASNILSGTLPVATDAVTVATTASEAMIVYGEGIETAPRYRQWNGTSLTPQGAMEDVGAPIRWAIVRAGTTREEYVAATVGTDADVSAQVFSTGEWGNLQEMTINMGSVNARGFDVAYETLSGDALVAYCDATTGEANYYIWNGTTWTAGAGITLGSANSCEWIQLASDPVSDEIILLSRDSTGGQYEAQVWNGTTWGNSTTQGSIVEAAHEGMSVMYEESGNQAVIVTSDGNPARFRWNSWNGTTWGTVATQTIGDDFEWGKLVRDIGTDEMMLCYQDEDSDIGYVHWTGAAWTGQGELIADGTANVKNDPAFACVFEDTSGRDNYVLQTFSNTTQTNYSTWNNTAWSTAAQVNTISDSATMQLIRTGDANILGIFFNDPNDTLAFSTWSGTAWSTTATLVADASVDTTPYREPYHMAPRNEGTTGTTIVSPAVNFSDGNGPYWKTFSWNDTQPGSSEILYHLQYLTSTGTWAFIPDVDLPGNVAGTTTGPFDLSDLNTVTYATLRPYAELSCDGSGNCPEISDWKIEWAGGITISGTAQEYDQATNVTAGAVAVAVNGVLQTGKTGAISAGTWSISNVTTFPGDVVTLFISSAADTNEAVAVTRYDGQGDIDGVVLYERHLTLGSNDATTTPLTNSDIGLYDFTNTEDVFVNVTGSLLEICVAGDCTDARLYVKAGTYYTPGGRVVTHDLVNNGIFTAGSFTHEVSGSWDDNGTSTLTGSTVVFAATSTTESIDTTGAVTSGFNTVTFGTTTGSGTWTLANTLDVNGNLTVSRGTLDRGTTSITVAGNLVTGANGFWSGLGTTTFDGTVAATWNDQNATKQNIGRAVIDGTNKVVTLAGNVAAESVTIGANDTLDASTSHFDITVYGSWSNSNNFLARNGEVFFAATSGGQTITTAGDAFYDLTFTGVGGAWSFTESTLLVNDDLTIATGTVTLPTATTTIAGNFDATGGAFAHNNGTMLFTSGAAKTITFAGGLFTNVAHNLVFNGAGSWTITDTNATTTNDLRVQQGTVNFPTGVLAVGGTVIDAGGTFVGGTGTVLFYSSVSEIITAGGSSFGSVVFEGTGDWSFADATADINGDLAVRQGTVTLPSGTLTVGGSYDNADTVVAGTGVVTFDSLDAGETIDFGASTLYNVVFDSVAGGWTIVSPATTTNNFALTSASDWTLASGQVLSVGGEFTNSVGGASTTWSGSTLSLEAGEYSINTKNDNGDVYETLRIATGAQIKLWNSSAASYQVASGASLYSQDHNEADGELHIFGEYSRTSGAEYWSYATDFDGTDLATTSSERPVDVRFASGASALLTNSTLEIVGDATASTTIANQGAGTYTVNISGGTTTAQYYEFADLGATGVSLLNAALVPLLRDGSYTVAAPGGTALTLSSTTIDANPGKQIYNVTFATTTVIAATNVTQTDGTPASFWWFRDGHGNLYGEGYDNDTGDPGSVRFDDSSLVITIAGTVYSDAGVTPIVGGTCNGTTPVVRVMIDGVLATTTSCSNVDGSYSAANIVVIGDPTITVFLNDASGGEKGSVITRTPTSDLLDMDIYADRVIVRNEDTDPLSIVNLAVYDSSDDSDLQFTAATSTSGDTLTVLAGNELRVSATSTFTPGGEVTLAANAAANGHDGTLYLANGATFNAYSTSTLTIGGRLALETATTFNAASTTVLMNASTTGKSITAPGEVVFNELTFNGTGGSWNLGADIRVEGDMTITAGTVTGTGDIYLPSGSLIGNGVLSLGGGTTTLAVSNTLGGTTAWTFYDLSLGDSLQVGTTTPLFTSTTTVSGTLTINAAHYLDAGSTVWDLAGAGTVFVENGTFIEDTSTIRYSGAGASVLPTQYYNLDLNAGAGTPTYTATGLGLIVDNDLTIGGDASSTFDLNTNDLLIDVNGSVIIRANGTLLASDTDEFTIAGSYTNDGIFTGNGGTLTFDGAGTTNIAAGVSSFSSVLIAATGDVSITEHATATDSFTLSTANTFTVTSGQALAVGDTFFNALGGAATDWTGSTLRLYGSNNYSINAATTTDTYGTLEVDDTTQIRMWNSDAGTYDVSATASLYSQDHGNDAGRLHIYGAYQHGSGTDHWSYATDFDGTALGGSSRKVDVYVATSSSVRYTGGGLSVVGNGTLGSTTVQALGTGTYGISVGGTASTTWRYYELRDMDSAGLVLAGTVDVHDLSDGDIEVSQNTGTGITVQDSVITSNPAELFYNNRFALVGAATGTNVTATGSPLSSWKFQSHYGGLDGESYDNDDGGDPGYIAWDNSTSTITVSGYVYSDEGTTPLPACIGNTNAIITLYVNGAVFDTVDCTDAGFFTFTDIVYSSNQSVIAYIDNGGADMGATVSVDLVSDVFNFNIYENRVIARHEATDPLTNAEFASWDSDNADIPYTANGGNLVLPADTKLLVWANKEFEPNGNVMVSGGGAGAAYDGTLELKNGATWTGQGTETLSIGGSFLLGSGAAFVSGSGTTTFTTTGAARTIAVNEGDFHHIAFTGSGSWTVTDPTLTVDGNFTQTNGSLTFPTGTSTFSGSFSKSGGTFDANDGLVVFSGTGAQTVTLGGSDLATVNFTSGNYSFGDTNATTTRSVTISGGSLSLPSGTLGVGGDFTNLGGSIVHNTSELVFSSTTAATLLASSSDLYGVRFIGGGTYTFADEDIALLDSLIIESGDVLLASGTVAIGGSFDASAGTFDHASGTILFNSVDGGEFVDAGTSPFYNVQFSTPTGGYTIIGNATTTNNFALASANSFTLQSGAVLAVQGVFANSVGGANTTWTGSTLKLDGANAYTVNTKTAGGDQYETLLIGANSDIRLWNSAATTTTVDSTASLYSQDHGTSNGSLYIYGDFHIGTTTEYWSYATDFDGASLTGSERPVTVAHAANATTTVDGGTLRIIGTSGNETTITNQGSGTYAMNVGAGTFTAQRYAFRNLNATGLNLYGTSAISSLSYGDFELAVDGGTLISLSSTTLNANASLVITGNRFATTTAITGNNVTLTGVTSNAWTFTSHPGNLDGENFDVDGATACGSVRWSDSACLLTQQTNYRWRNDDGGLGVPDGEWYDLDWAARQYVRVKNVDSTSYTDAAVKLIVEYDADMQADFDDLRFTASDGTTRISHWVGSSTDGTAAEVWVQVPSLAAEDTTDVFMYYSNPTATSVSSSSAVFIAADDFEDGSISEYTGQTSLFSISTTFNNDGTYGIDNAGNESGRANLGGIFRFDQTVSQGETFRYKQYVDTTAGTSDETCTLFGVQSPGTTNDNYAVCIEQFGIDRISLVRDVVDNDASGVILASSTVTYTTGWYEVEVDWGTDDSFTVLLYDESDSLVTTFSASDSTYTSGGIGFTFWFHNGGWDSVSSRPTLTTEPTILFGAEQAAGGATWKAAQNTAGTYNVSDIARLRVSIENTGLPITDQQFLLEYALRDTAPSCEAVSPSEYAPVPTQASCGTSPVCMQSSSFVANGAATVDLLREVEGTFVAGELREDPTNITGNIDVAQNEYTELEYVVTPTNNVADESLCFRVTDNGTEYDTYLRVAELNLRFDPVLGAITLNEGLPISLLPGTTTRVYATGTVSDFNGYTDLVLASSTIYRSGVSGGAACTPDNNDCYVSTEATSCAFTTCAGDSCTIACYADIYFHADPTDAGTYEGEEWLAFIEVEDTSGGYDFASAPGVELETLRAIDVAGTIDYGALAVNTNTGSFNASTSVLNLGNVAIDLEITGTDLSDGEASVIPADNQKFATSTFVYADCGVSEPCKELSSTTPVAIDVELGKPSVDTPPVADAVYWGIAVPIGVNSVPHQGINVFTPISP